MNIKLIKGLFIAIEGLDKAGKTILIKALKEHFKEYDIVYTREPGGTELGNIIRSILLNETYMNKDENEWINGKAFMSPKTEALLYAASRQEHVDELIKPNLEKKRIIISDRYIHTSLVYQGLVRGLTIQYIRKINPDVYPDLTIILNGDSEKILSRGDRPEDNRYEKEEGHEFHKKCECGYNMLYKFMKIENDFSDRVEKIDATLSPEQVFEQAKSYIEDLINKYKEE